MPKAYDPDQIKCVVGDVECQPDIAENIEFKVIVVPIKKGSLERFILNFPKSSDFGISQDGRLILELADIKIKFVTDKKAFFNVGIYGRLLQYHPENYR
jgi:hypothetical protein